MTTVERSRIAGEAVTLNHIDLFSGIGGFSLASRNVGFTTIQFCEIEPFPQAVLRKNFPGVPIHADITTFDGQPFRGRVDLLTAGFPCQPFSVAGKQAGAADSRFLWPELIRVIRECRPAFLLLENVPGLRTIAADRVLQDLDEAGYTAEAFVVGADDIGATHRRKRVWIVAFRESEGLSPGRDRQVCNDRERLSNHSSGSSRTVEDAGHGAGRRECEAAAGHYDRRQRSQVAGTPSIAGSEMADAEEAMPCRTGPAWSGRAGLADDGDDAMADAQGEQSGGLFLSAVSANSGRNCPDFPPGPDGDWSAIPAEFWPIELEIRVLAPKLPARLVRWRKDREEETVNGQTFNLSAAEAMRFLQSDDGKKAIQRTPRRRCKILHEEILQSGLYGEGVCQGGSGSEDLSPEGKSAQAGFMQSMWQRIQSARSPQGRERNKQRSCELADLVRFLSSEMALEEWEEAVEGTLRLHNLRSAIEAGSDVPEAFSTLQEAWLSLCGEVRREVATVAGLIGVPNTGYKAAILKGLGNAIVPAVAEVFMRWIQKELTA